MSLVRQPDGKYAMWSGIVDSFTHLEMDENQAIEEVVIRHIRGAVAEAKRQIEHANTKTERWLEFLETMTRVHGAQDVRQTFDNCYASKLIEGVELEDWKTYEEEEAEA